MELMATEELFISQGDENPLEEVTQLSSLPTLQEARLALELWKQV